MRVSGIPYIQGRNDYADPDGKKYGIAIHNTANDASAEGEASYATRRTDGVSSHFYVDADSVVQSLDTADRAGHAGSAEGNNHAVAVEITGTNSKSRQWWLDNVAWDLLGRVLADVCRHYGIAPRRASVAEMKANPRIKAFYGHDDMRRAWGSTTHTDPGDNFPWDRLFQAVNAHLNPEEDPMGALSADDQRALIWRVEGLASGRTIVAGGPTAGEPIVANVRVVAMEQKLAAVLTALAGVDEATAAALAGRFADIDAAQQTMLDAVAEIPALTVEALGAVDSPEEIAERLRAVLGDKAAAVGALLAQA